MRSGQLSRLIEYIAIEARSAGRAKELIEELMALSEEDWERFISDASTRFRKREYSRVYRANKRARDMGLPATLTSREWFETLEYFDYRCAYCGELFSYEHIEHFVPLSSEESCVGTTAHNCVPACSACNAKKGVKEADYWRNLLMRRDFWGGKDEFARRVMQVGTYLQSRKEELGEPHSEKPLFSESGH